MPSRPRTPSPDAAGRFRAIFGEPGGTGWVPSSAPPAVPAPDEVASLPDRSVEQSAAAAPLASVAGRLRAGRFDPGHRGALGLAAVALLAAVVAVLVLLRSRPSEQPLAVPSVSRPAAAPSAAAGGEVVVDVAGRVARPGLVRLPAGSRVDDALRAAGGLVAGASPGLLNLARKLLDGEQVLVGVPPPPPPPAAGTGAGPAGGGPTGSGPLDLNAAAASDLDGLPGIGPVLAERIVSWRAAHGRFASVDQLRQVSGIGESKYQLIRNRVRV